MDGTEIRLKRIERQEKGGMGWPMRLVLLGILGAGGAVLYVTQKQDQKSIAETGVILPDVLIKKASASRHDLALLDRELCELAVEADKHLTPKPGPGNHKRADRYLAQLAQLKTTGDGIRPNLTKEETLVLTATEHSETMIGDFIRSSFDASTINHSIIEKAEKQLGREQALAQGEGANPLMKTDKLKSIATVGKEVANVRENLKTIKASQDMARATAADNSDALNVPGFDDAAKAVSGKSHHHKKKHHDETAADAPAE